MHIKCWVISETMICCSQFIERTELAAKSKINGVGSRIIPGDWGKAGSGWLTGLLLNRAARFGGGRIHQFLWRRSRAVKMRMRDLAARSDEKPLRVESSSPGKFRFRANRSHPKGARLLLWISTVRTALAGATQLRPPSERRRKADKGSGRIGKSTGTGQVP